MTNPFYFANSEAAHERAAAIRGCFLPAQTQAVQWAVTVVIHGRFTVIYACGYGGVHEENWQVWTTEDEEQWQ